jgi:hypothetical protein
MRQAYETWNVAPGLDVADVTIEAVIDDWEGFRVLLRDHNGGRIFRITFEKHVAYLCRDESDLVGEVSRSDCVKGRLFYQVRNSEFLQRFAVDSAREYRDLRHYAIMTGVHCVDVLTQAEPRIEWL